MAGLKKEQLWNLRLRDARREIVAALPERAYSRSAIESVLSDNREAWRFPRTLHSDYFLEYLTRTKLFKRLLFTRIGEEPSASYSGEMTLFVTPDASRFDIALGLRNGSFLSHLSAAYLHGLTNLLPSVFYTNKEQAPKKTSRTRETELVQEAVDRAFAKPARSTGLSYSDGEVRVILLNGMFTDELDVHEVTSAEEGRMYRATSLERTLIDCTVRPAHAGGIHEVLAMYEAARERISLRRLRKLLDDLAFIYPYRQAVGFLLERAGYTRKQTDLFAHPNFTLNFYLDYAIPEAEFSSTWRLHYPRGF